MICSSLNRLLRTTPPPGPGRAILNGRSHISTGLISGGQVTRMVKVFSTMADYVTFLTALPIAEGEVFCLSFMPSSLFPKHAISHYFLDIDPIKEHQVVTSRLWSYGRDVLHHLGRGQAELIIELAALQRLCESGSIHITSPRFEVGYAIRLQALKALRKLAEKDTVSFTTEVMPFTFRLHLPYGVLIDVGPNTNSQAVQGIWIDDEDSFVRFSSEFERLQRSECLRGDRLLKIIDKAMREFAIGRCYKGPW
jgi:hypothetical protein